VCVRRRLDTELVRRGLLPSRRQAVEAIAAGRVLVAGSTARVAARLVDGAEPIKVERGGPRFVSRGGEKLAAALDHFSIDVSGRRALDAGASTGGFTDCLLRAGAAKVVAVDVGRGQLAWSLRTDPRVDLRERTNVRTLTPDVIGGPVDLVVADLSFISLLTVAPALAGVLASGMRTRGELVLLLKPQFEAGRARVGKGGVIRDPAVHRAVLDEVSDGLERHGLVVVDATRSPLLGASGNVEFLLHVKPSGSRVDPGVLDECAGARHGGQAPA
jgi:23S rRNA (cytidine1920-2'-O)/16S rRNA (cytidine1409-2'-O)-methyltransferase